jgi:PiT family inorganic phosphate transporter
MLISKNMETTNQEAIEISDANSNSTKEDDKTFEFAIKQCKLISEVYRVLMIVSAFLVCLSHGSNDVGNAISPMLVIMNIEGLNTQYGFLIGSVGIALGLLILGYKVMNTVGKDIILLDFMKGFAA